MHDPQLLVRLHGSHRPYGMQHGSERRLLGRLLGPATMNSADTTTEGGLSTRRTASASSGIASASRTKGLVLRRGHKLQLASAVGLGRAECKDTVRCTTGLVVTLRCPRRHGQHQTKVEVEQSQLLALLADHGDCALPFQPLLSCCLMSSRILAMSLRIALNCRRSASSVFPTFGTSCCTTTRGKTACLLAAFAFSFADGGGRGGLHLAPVRSASQRPAVSAFSSAQVAPPRAARRPVGPACRRQSHYLKPQCRLPAPAPRSEQQRQQHPERRSRSPAAAPPARSSAAAAAHRASRPRAALRRSRKATCGRGQSPRAVA
jgi:hypothetical protein